MHHNRFLPRGGTSVHAVVSVQAGEDRVTPELAEIVMIDCSGSMAGRGKIEAAREATVAAIEGLADGTWFAVVAGTDTARVVYPAADRMFQATPATRGAAARAVARLEAGGETAIAPWLALARSLFVTRPGAIRHAILLTDGLTMRTGLDEELRRCAGMFQCDCRGVGTDWNVAELRGIADALMGTVDIIPRPRDMRAEFGRLIGRAMSRLAAVEIAIVTPAGVSVERFKQAWPEQADVPRAATGRHATGAWTGGEQRDYHLDLRVDAREVGAAGEVHVARVGVVAFGAEVHHASLGVVWTDDADRSARLDPRVAHYEGQAEMAETIVRGLEARRRGDLDLAAHLLGRAVQLAHESSNLEATQLLRGVVEIVDAAGGVVRLRRSVSREAEMTLDSRSRRTTRVRER